MTVAELIERLKDLPPDMPVLQDGGFSPGLHPVTDLHTFRCGPETWRGHQIIQMYADGPDAFEALVF